LRPRAVVTRTQRALVLTAGHPNRHKPRTDCVRYTRRGKRLMRLDFFAHWMITAGAAALLLLGAWILNIIDRHRSHRRQQ
jgi:hypothetical protein